MFRNSSAIALFILIALAVPLRAEEFSRQFTAVTPPAALPDFLFEDGKGQSLRVADFRGHALLLHLWATWCGPCVEEMPSLDALQAKIGGANLTVIAINEERSGADAAASFYKRHGVKNLAVYSDPSGRIASLLHARGLPMSFLIDATGHEIGRIDGSADWGSAETAAQFRDILNLKN
jgi:thiol-disulfide isomerase/thioredoxin